MREIGGELAAALGRVAREWAGAVPLDALEAALPEATSGEDMDAALVWLAERSIQVTEERGGEAQPSSVEAGAAALLLDGQPPPLDQLLGTSFALSRIFAAAAASRTGMFVEGLGAGARRLALDQVAGLRDAYEEARRIRNTLGTKKLSETKRRELKAALREAERRVHDALHVLPLRDAWVARLVSVFRRAGEEIEQSTAAFADLERKRGVPVRELKRKLREAREDGNATNKLARRLGLSAAEVQRLDREVRTLGRRILRQQEGLEAPAARILELLAVARKWEAHRAQAARLARDGSSGRTFMPLETLVARVDEVAAHAVVLTELPKRRNAVPVPRAHRRVAFVARGADDRSPAEPGAATSADLGRVGEAVIFEMMRRRWEDAARIAPESTAALLRRIAAECWSLDDDQARSLDATLSGVATVRGRARPPLASRTAYGDAMGFDIFGLAEDGADWLCVEVKTTLGPPAAQFELTANEFERARQKGSRYVIARVANFNAARPAIYFWQDPVALVKGGALRLTPSAYSVSFGER